MNEQHSSAHREKPSVSTWQIPSHRDKSRVLPLALLWCHGALSLTQVGKQRQQPWPHMLEWGDQCKQGCRAAGVEERLNMLQHAWKWKITLGRDSCTAGTGCKSSFLESPSS